jgi:hypothetical protein
MKHLFPLPKSQLPESQGYLLSPHTSPPSTAIKANTPPSTPPPRTFIPSAPLAFVALALALPAATEAVVPVTTAAVLPVATAVPPPVVVLTVFEVAPAMTDVAGEVLTCEADEAEEAEEEPPAEEPEATAFAASTMPPWGWFGVVAEPTKDLDLVIQAAAVLPEELGGVSKATTETRAARVMGNG